MLRFVVGLFARSVYRMILFYLNGFVILGIFLLIRGELRVACFIAGGSRF